jgi:hypothetical protein
VGNNYKKCELGNIFTFLVNASDIARQDGATHVYPVTVAGIEGVAGAGEESLDVAETRDLKLLRLALDHLPAPGDVVISRRSLVAISNAVWMVRV